MKVLILSTFGTSGGAAIAASRLLHALRKNGVEANMLCRKNIGFGPKALRKQSWTSILERVVIWVANGLSAKNLWATDIALFGQDIRRTKEYKEADVVHLHWVNQGFITLSAVKKFIDDGKKVVWTMHDAWNTMGVYHLRLQQKDTWLERWIRARKERLYRTGGIDFVTCSKWLMQEALVSDLMHRQKVVAIANTIDVEVFRPQAHANARKVLFVAQSVDNPMKGIKYLDEAARLLDNVQIVALGRDIAYISDAHEMARLYAGVDAFVLPSLSENLPNTIMEAMACGVPCVGFDVGGIPEMIDHKVNGYVARYKDAEDLAAGIAYVLDEVQHERLSKACVEKVERCYSEKAVAGKYLEVYNS